MYQPRIALITILTEDTPALARFYKEVLGFTMKLDMGHYVEFESPGVRFSICERHVLGEATGHPSYLLKPEGHSFELAFPLPSPAEVDSFYAEIIARGAVQVKPPADMVWGQRTAFFADPDGNIHEIFADLVP